MENFQPIEFQQARDFSKKLNATFEFLRQNFKPLTKCLLYLAGPVILLGSLLTGSLYSGYLQSITSAGRNPDQVFRFISSVNTWTQAAFAAVFVFIGGVVIVSVVYNYMLEYQERQSNRIEVDAVWQRVRRSLPSYLATFFLFSLLILSGYALIILLTIGASRISITTTILLVVIAIFAFIYAIIPLSLLFPIRAFEKINFIEAAGRCFELIKGKWWSTFGLLVVAGLVQSMIASAFFIPWYINFIITMLHSVEGHGGYEPSWFSQIINSVFIVLYFLATFILYAIPLVALAFQYFNLVELKESRGLMSRIQQM